MGFPSPAKDYAESRLTLDVLCHFDANCKLINTSKGFAVINTSIKPNEGQVMYVSHFGSVYFAVRHGDALLLSDGEAIEGEALDDVEVIGVVTFLINRAATPEEYDLPVM